ncbi:MAG: zinc transporter ZupT [Dehalococcoidales bacterium]|nr:zinc transporter ZupT [Dehalococcoidales bacterium]
MASNITFALLLTLIAGLSTGIGSTIAYFLHKPKSQHMCLILGFSAGVMLYVSFAELLHVALEKVGFLTANLGFFIGIIAIALLDILIPHEYKQEHVEELSNGADTTVQPGRHGYRHGAKHASRLRRAGILMALGIAIHNFPEGIAVFSSGITGDTGFGILVAIAIALHNIPEGISVSVPIVEATGKRGRAFLYSFAAGLAEPVGALIGFAVLFPFLTPTLIYTLLAFAAGIMVYISLDELLPTAHLYGEEHVVIIGVLAGMAVMALSILMLS